MLCTVDDWLLGLIALRPLINDDDEEEEEDEDDFLITVSFSHERALLYIYIYKYMYSLPCIGRSITYYTVHNCVFLRCSWEFWGILVLPRTGRPYNKNYKAGNFSQWSPQLISHFARNFPLLQVSRRPASTTWKPRCVGTFVPKISALSRF